MCIKNSDVYFLLKYIQALKGSWGPTEGGRYRFNTIAFQQGFVWNFNYNSVYYF